MTSDVQRDPLIERYAEQLAGVMKMRAVARRTRTFWCRDLERAARYELDALRIAETGRMASRGEVDAFVARLRERAQERC